MDPKISRQRQAEVTGERGGVMGGSPRARVSLLNGFELEISDGHRPTAVSALPRSLQRLVAHLGLAGRPGRAAIAGQLWPDVPEEHAQGSLRSVLWRLQKAVPG